MSQQNPFKRATKTQSRLRMALFGASGSGKTYTALSIAAAFGTIAVIDTEHGSASKYADRFEFDVLELSDYAPKAYVAAIEAAADYDVLIIDSLTHAWAGSGGVLEIADRGAARAQGNKFAGWRDATPEHNRLVEAILTARPHVIVTMRSKTEYVLEPDSRGKMSPRKVGTAPVQRDGMEYEFDIVGEMNADNELVISKTRFPQLKGEVQKEPSRDFGTLILQQLQDGAPPPAQPTPVSGGNSRPLASDGSTPVSPSSAGASSSAPAGGKDDTFGKQFPPRVVVTSTALWDAMHDFFDNPHHFEAHWQKHASTYANMTLEEASAWLRNYHWNYDKDQCKRLVADAKANYGMDIDNVMEALSNGAGHSVKRMVQWDGGDWGAARAAITLWAEAHKQEAVSA